MGFFATVDTSGPLFDGLAAEALHAGADAVRHDLAKEGERLVASAFLGQIRVNHGVFLSTITSIDSTHAFEWEGNWTRDVDSGPAKGQKEHVSKVYTMPIVVNAGETIVTSELAMYGPWLEGTGSRNESTRFRGYHGFRLGAQALNVVADQIATRALDPYVARCNA